MGTTKPRIPVDPITVGVTREIAACLSGTGSPFMLVGATARDILLQNVHGLTPSRATRDIDFAVALPDWAAYQALRAGLLATERFCDSTQPQRLIYRPSQTDIDLIPFGVIERAPATVAWPPDFNVMLNVSGYRDALEAAISVELEPGLEVRVASLAGIALLKFFAWNDRGATEPKDAIDLANLLNNYADAGNHDRVYEEAIKTLESLDYDPQKTGMWLLGQDTARITSEDSCSKLLKILLDRRRLDTLATDMIRSAKDYRDGAFEETVQNLHIFRDGFESVSSANKD